MYFSGIHIKACTSSNHSYILFYQFHINFGNFIHRGIHVLKFNMCFTHTKVKTKQWIICRVTTLLQVKNFGRSGRTKYTHLVDQDTTQFDSPWIADTAQNLKTHMTKGGGMKQVFSRPAAKSKRK